MGLMVGVIGLALLATDTMVERVALQMDCLARLQQVMQEQYQAAAAVRLFLMKTPAIQTLLGTRAARRVAAVMLPFL